MKLWPRVWCLVFLTHGVYFTGVPLPRSLLNMSPKFSLMQSRTNMFFTLQTVSAFMWQVNWRVKQHVVTNALEMCRDLMPLVQKTISTARSWLVKNTFMPQSHLVGVVTYAKCCVDFFRI